MLVNSDESRVARKVILEQEEKGHELCWFADVREEAGEIGISLHREVVENKPKSWWKSEVKKAIHTELRKTDEQPSFDNEETPFPTFKGS